MPTRVPCLHLAPPPRLRKTTFFPDGIGCQFWNFDNFHSSRLDGRPPRKLCCIWYYICIFTYSFFICEIWYDINQVVYTKCISRFETIYVYTKIVKLSKNLWSRDFKDYRDITHAFQAWGANPPFFLIMVLTWPGSICRGVSFQTVALARKILFFCPYHLHPLAESGIGPGLQPVWTLPRFDCVAVVLCIRCVKFNKMD